MTGRAIYPGGSGWVPPAVSTGPGPLHITDVAFTPGTPRDRARGLLGYVRCRLGDLRLDGLALHRTVDGRRAVAFPKRRDGTGRWRPYVAPVDDATRRHIEQQILEALDRGQPGAE